MASSTDDRNLACPFFLILCAVLALGAWSSGIAAEFNPAPLEPAMGAQATSGRIILGFRNGATRAAAGSTAAAEGLLAAQKLGALSTRTGVPFKGSRRLGAAMQVLEVAVPATSQGIEQTLELLRADPDVEFAEADQRRFPHAIPNDTLFPGQWYLRKAAITPSAVDAVAAWDLTTGSQGVVVADLDTGVRYDHPDLRPATAGGRLLPGFDFISDRDNANDGDGWDADPSDPGDWVTSAESALGPLSGCPVGDSSWHGTRVAGIIGALTNNAQGVSGIAWSGWVLPARALGKCGGFDSDIIAAMLWSGGVAVSGAPANPYPAKIINMSLGGKGSCSQSYSNAVSQLTARGVLVVASVGNEGGPVVAPANCPGVVGVGGLRHAGTKVGFSNLGPGTAISAPGGNCVNTGAGEPCIYSIDTTTNLGTQSPTENGYTDQIRFNVGTSFSAPIVSGIVGLMAAVNGRLSPAQLTARLQEGATLPFPASSDPTVPTCRVPTGPSDLQTSECVCTTLTCGAGMANALGAVNAALRPVAAVLPPATVSAGQNVVLRGSGSGAACSRQLTSYAWTIVDPGPTPPGIVGGQTDTAIVVAPSTGSFTVRLTVTDDLGRQDSADVLVTPNSATTAAPATAGGPACPTPVEVILPITVSVTPDSVTLVAGTGTQAFTATVANSSDTRVSWSVNGIVGGNASVGTISATGSYVAPATRPDPATVKVTATSVADPSRSGSSTVTISQPPFKPGSGGGGGGGGLDFLVLLIVGASALGRRARLPR
jgi:serine protease